jgi:hypothetical protein
VRSQEEITHFAADWLDKRYGDRVAVEFLDASKPEAAASLDKLGPLVNRLRMRLPIVTIDDQVARIEWFSAWGLIDAVEAYISQKLGQK